MSGTVNNIINEPAVSDKLPVFHIYNASVRRPPYARSIEAANLA